MKSSIRSHIGEAVQVRVEMTNEQRADLIKTSFDEISQISEVQELKQKRTALVDRAKKLKWGVLPEELSEAEELFHETFLNVDKHLSHRRAVLDVSEFGVRFEAEVVPTAPDIDFSSLRLGELSVAAIGVYTNRTLGSLAIREHRDEDYMGSDEPDAEIGFVIDAETDIQVVEGLILPYEGVTSEGGSLMAALARTA